MQAIRPKITTLEVCEPGDTAPDFMFIPESGFDAALADRAVERVGAAAYAVLRTQVFLATPQLKDSMQALVTTLELSRQRLVAQAGESADRVSLDLEYSEVGKAMHWQAITQFGVIVENFAALLHGLDAYRAGADVASAFLDHDLDLIGLLNEKRRRRLSYWEQCIRRPSDGELSAAGLDRDEVHAMRAGSRELAQRLAIGFRDVRAYYTPALHSVYTRYKHGYSLVAPHLSPLPVQGQMPQRDAEAALRGGFAVMHQRRHDGRRVIQVVQTGETELRACVVTALKALSLASTLVHIWLMEVEHPQERSIAIARSDEPATAAVQQHALRKWVGEAFDSIYSLPGIIGTDLSDASADAIAQEVLEAARP